jgi:hypothetical protein
MAEKKVMEKKMVNMTEKAVENTKANTKVSTINIFQGGKFHEKSHTCSATNNKQYLR